MDHVHLTVGSTYLVVLRGLGTAGYRWFATVDEPDVVEIQSHSADAGSGAELPGRSRKEEFIVAALRAGTAVVRFDQRRSFEPNKAPNATREFQFHVT
jgi:predicted secreted protein